MVFFEFNSQPPINRPLIKLKKMDIENHFDITNYELSYQNYLIFQIVVMLRIIFILFVIIHIRLNIMSGTYLNEMTLYHTFNAFDGELYGTTLFYVPKNK